MLKYSFTRREKALILVLAVVLVAVAWFVFVYQGTSEQITKIEGELATVESEISLDTARVAKLEQMREDVAKRKAEGARAVEMPKYDNIKPLMTQLNNVMSAADTYTLTFDDLQSDGGQYMLRGVRIDYGTQTFRAAEDLARTLSNGQYPCSVDTMSIVDKTTSSASVRGNSTSPVTASVHVTFYEQLG